MSTGDFRVADISLADFGRKEIDLAEHEVRHQQIGLIGRSLWPQFGKGEELEWDQACQVTLMQVPCFLYHDILLPLILGKLQEILQSLPGREDLLCRWMKGEC